MCATACLLLPLLGTAATFINLLMPQMKGWRYVRATACLLLPLLGTAATFTNLLMPQMKGVEVRVCYCLLATACHSVVPQGGLLPATAYLTSSRVS